MQIWLILVSPLLEAGTTVRKAVSDSSSPGPFGLIVTEVIVCLVTRDSGLTSYKSHSQQGSLLGWLLQRRGWFPGQGAANYGSLFYFYKSLSIFMYGVNIVCV